jgi:cytochrome c peroxidase
MKRLAALAAAIGFVVAASPHAARAQTGPTKWIPNGLPSDLWQILVPSDNPVTDDKVALGRALFFDKRLSKDGTVACATCHDPAFGFAERKPVAEGVGGRMGARNTPTILNAVFNEAQFWDGRSATLEEQAKGPFVNPVEMGFATHDEVLSVVRSIPEYRDAFRAAFGREATLDDLAAAIATFERTVLSGDAPFDRFIAGAGDDSAIPAAARRGWFLWNSRARCHTCHPFSAATPNFSDNKFHNTGVGAKGRDYAALAREAAGRTADDLARSPGTSELGRWIVTRQTRDLGSFKTPGMRDVARTAPYMHDGSLATLHDVVDFYDRGGEPNARLDPLMAPLKLSDRDKLDLIAFMDALTGKPAAPAPLTVVPATAARQQ